MYKVYFTSQAKKDAKNPLREKCEELIELLAKNPFQEHPPYKRLSGDLSSFHSRRISRQHRLVYEIDENKKAVKILSMWSHYKNA